MNWWILLITFGVRHVSIGLVFLLFLWEITNFVACHTIFNFFSSKCNYIINLIVSPTNIYIYIYNYTVFFFYNYYDKISYDYWSTHMKVIFVNHNRPCQPQTQAKILLYYRVQIVKLVFELSKPTSLPHWSIPLHTDRHFITSQPSIRPRFNSPDSPNHRPWFSPSPY